MTDIIKRAVELADGSFWFETFPVFDDPDAAAQQRFLDALAAQLVRQVDAHRRFYVIIYPKVSEIHAIVHYDEYAESSPTERSEGPDRTMNTIKAIVESGVLDD